MDGIGHTVNLRVDSVVGEHVHCTLFMNGGNAGTFILRVGEYQIFATALGLGAERTMGHLKDTSDSRVFKEWADKGGKVI